MSWRGVGAAGSIYEKNTPVIRHEKLKTAQTDVLCEVGVQGGAGSQVHSVVKELVHVLSVPVVK